MMKKIMKRAGYVLAHWDYFRTHLAESWRLWRGGIDYHAALLGSLLGIIEFPEQPANCTFAGPGNKTLYATARTSLYAVPMEATGHVFPAGKR